MKHFLTSIMMAFQKHQYRESAVIRNTCNFCGMSRANGDHF